MNEISEDAWFYTREGERIGPVSFTDLRLLASEAKLNPRLDMIWKSGMPEWKAAGEIEGLFERRTPPLPQEGLAPAADPYRPPHEETAEEIMSRQTDWPGMRRRSYWFLTFILPIGINIALVAGATMLGEKFDEKMVGSITLGALLLVSLLAFIAGLQRLANLGMSRWWYLGYLIPGLNFWIGYRSLCCPAGYAFHKKMDGIGIFVAILYWLLIGISILSLVLMIIVFLGMAGDPELQKQIREALDQAAAPRS